MAHRIVHRQWAATIARGVLSAALIAALAGCASNQPKAATTADSNEPVNTGLAALMRDSEIDTSALPSGPPESLTDSQVAALVQRSALDLEKVFADQAERMNRPKTPATDLPALDAAAPPSPTPPTPADSTPTFALNDVAASANAGAPTPDATAVPDATTAQTTPTATTPPATTPPATTPAQVQPLVQPPAQPAAAPAPNPALATLAPEDRLLVETASRIIDLMKPPPLADGTQAQGMNEALALAAIESVKPGTLATIDDPNAPLAKGLSPERYAALRDARDRVAQNPTAAHGAAQQALTSLAPSLQMSSVRLCTRVMGFGRYDAYPSTDFVAGRAIRAIVYAQIDGFTVRPAKNTDPVQPNVPLDEQKTVDLSQSLTLYHDTGTMQAWHRPFQRVVETSRDVRQDFYLIQQIELPKQLPIGEYRLKVTVRDNASGAEHEAFIPLRVVAGGSSMTDAR